MSKVIAITNQKGGVGKTTTAVNLSAWLAEMGKKTLMVDLDPQGNTTSGLGEDKSGDHTVYEILLGEEKIEDCICHTQVENLDLVPSNVNLSGAEIELIGIPDKEYLPDWMNTRQLMHFYGDFYDDFDPRRASVMLSSLDIPSDMVLKKMSKGTREKVQLILTMSRRAKVYLLDEPIAGVDPAARDYILRTIIQNYEENSLVLISTHLIADVESVLDEAVFLKQGHIVLHKPADEIRTETGKSVDDYFREGFRC